MNIIILDGRRMTDRRRTHTYLAQALSLPDYYGRNLDALYDCVTEMSGVQIVLTCIAEMSENLANYGDMLLAVFAEAAEENPNIVFIAENEIEITEDDRDFEDDDLE